MKYIDDILYFLGGIAISAAAFGCDWRIGALTVGVWMMVTAIIIAKGTGGKR